MTKLAISIFFIFSFCNLLDYSTGFKIGRGIADATGVIAEGILYGYANPGQDARGLHLRQFSRAFIIGNQDDSKRVVIVVVEATMISQAVRLGVHEKLNKTYGALYTMDNVMLLPTHSHSCPGGFHTYLMYVAPSLGFVKQTYDAFVDGIFESIQNAHNSIQNGDILVLADELLDASINRSPASYDNNPAKEKNRYRHNVDKDMTILRFTEEDEAKKTLGIISFFAVHTTSMKNTNHLLSTDNKGYAAQMMERILNPGVFPGKANIPVAFGQTAVGDVTPNTRGALCEVTDEPCDYFNSSCPADVTNPALCTGRGLKGDEFEDTKDIGDKQFRKVLEKMNSASAKLTGEISFIHAHVNMSQVLVKGSNGSQVSLCRPAMGFSFAAGATDGPGIPPFIQGDTEGNEFLKNLVKTVVPYPKAYEECHSPKPVLLPTGEAKIGWPWQPEIVALQIFRIGDLVLVGLPTEITTMSGRRIAESVRKTLIDNGYPSSTRILVLSMANGYTSYLTTEEEYQIQRYEGASTVFGPHTLNGYIKELKRLATAMAKGDKTAPGPTPPDLRGLAPSATGAIRTDSLGSEENYGDVLQDVRQNYTQGDQVKVIFRSGNPRNDLKRGSTYVEVQERKGDGSWAVIATDAFWETKLFWNSDCHDSGIIPPLRCLLAQKSNVTVTWDIPANQNPGFYRILHMGVAMGTFTTKSYIGTSSVLEVLP